MSDLNDLFKQLAEEKAKDPKYQQQAKIRENVRADLSTLFSQLSSINKKVEDVQHPEVKAVVEEVVEAAVEQITEDVIVEVALPTPIGKVPEVAQIPDLDKYLKKKPELPKEDPLINQYRQVQDKLKFLEQWVSKIQNAGPGSGEVNFRYLDDVARSTMNPENDNWVLEYDATTKKVQFTENIGPIRTVKFNTAGPITELVAGQSAWNPIEDCLDTRNVDGSTLQHGLELHIRVHNHTGATLTNGSVVRFAGINTEGDYEPMVAPHIANGTIHGLYTVGIMTNDVHDGETGRATWFGKVRNIDTTGASSGETWHAGDLLYVHPTIAGKLTNVKPHAPNIVVSVAAAMKIGQTDGILLVRPTIYPRLYYGSFSDSLEQTAAAINTPYAVKHRVTDIANGHHVTDESKIVAEVSGAYNYQFSLQIASTSASKKELYIWARVNGVDVPRSATRLTITGNDEYRAPSWNYVLPMNAGDYFELMWAVSDIGIKIAAPGATSFCPAIPSSILTVTQSAL